MNDNNWWIYNLKNKDENAIRELFNIVVGYLRSNFSNYYDYAEDVAQETIIVVLTNLDKFDGNSRLTTWVIGISRNKMLDQIKSLNKKFAEELPEEFELSDSYILIEQIRNKILEDRPYLDTRKGGQKRVTERDWSIFKEYVLLEKDANVVAQEFELSVGYVIKLSSQVRSIFHRYLKETYNE